MPSIGRPSTAMFADPKCVSCRRREGRWGKVRALQRLLTHSYSGKVLAVRRVTENQGKKTPGVDRVIWATPEKKMQAVHELKQGRIYWMGRQERFHARDLGKAGLEVEQPH